MFLTYKLHVDMHSEIVDVADVFKRVAVDMDV